MKPETRQKLSALNREVPGFLKEKAVEKLRRAKDPMAVFVVAIELLLVLGLVFSFVIFIDPDVNVISEQQLPNWAKVPSFIFLAAVAILIFLYNKKFFAQAARDTKWVWRWKAKKPK